MPASNGAAQDGATHKSIPHNDALATEFFENGKQVTAAVTIQRPAAEIYAALSNLADLPRFADQIEAIERAADPKDKAHACWTGKTISGDTFAWQAEVLRAEPGKVFSWRGVGDEGLASAGSLTLHELPFCRGTEVKVVIDYLPATGPISQKVSRAVGKDPKSYLQAALFRLRQWLETGEIATTKGQPVGRGSGRAEEGSHDEKRLGGSDLDGGGGNGGGIASTPRITHDDSTDTESAR
jgi:uncharacterized membrane protein